MLGEDDKLKCTVCTQCRRSYVSVSWESLNISQDNFCEDVATEEVTCDTLFKQLATVQVHLSWKQKLLEDAEVCTR